MDLLKFQDSISVCVIFLENCINDLIKLFKRNSVHCGWILILNLLVIFIIINGIRSHLY